MDSQFHFVDGRRLASYDAGPTSPILAEDYLTGLRTMSETILRHDTLDYLTKEYSIELKPLFSAFQMKSLGLTIIRSFSLYYLPLLQPKVEDDDNDFLPDDERPVDLIEPFKKSVKQILCELLKDIPKSALRKSKRGMPFYTYTVCVGRTTFRGHFLGVATSWLVQVGIECYRCVRDIAKSENEGEDVDIVVYKGERAKVLGKRVCGVTVRCGVSLVFASIGAGIGATLLRPRTGRSLVFLIFANQVDGWYTSSYEITIDIEQQTRTAESIKDC
ncbi:hypothetical protein Tco_0296571 [Tanacetum coccineum]